MRHQTLQVPRLSILLLPLGLLLASALTLRPAWASDADPSAARQLRFHYAGGDRQGEFSVSEIVAFIAEDRKGTHYVWSAGWEDWKPWADVLEIATLLPPPPPPVVRASPPSPPPPPNVRTAASPQAPTPPAPPAPRPRSAPPTEAPPKVVPSNPPTEGPVTRAAPETADKGGCHGHDGACGTPRLTVGGEAWFDFLVDGLGASAEDGAADASLQTSFLVTRARVRTEIDLARGLRAMMNVDLPQTGTSTVYGVDGDTNDLGVDMGHTVTVLDAAGGWTPLVKDLYVDGKAGMHRIRVGVQKPIFSTMDRYDDYNAYFLGGLDAHKALAWRMGIVPSRDLGARWSVAPSSSFSVDLQVSNGTGERALENNPGKDLSGRVVLEPHELVRIEGSVLHGARGALGKDSLSAFALAAELRTRGPRLIAEALMGNAMLQETAHGFMGVSITGAWPIEIPGERIDHLVILGRYMTGDPDTRDGEGDDFASGVDAWGMGNLATQLYWKTTRPEQTLLSGLSYEVLVPQNAEIPVGHGLVAQLAWKF